MFATKSKQTLLAFKKHKYEQTIVYYFKWIFEFLYDLKKDELWKNIVFIVCIHFFMLLMNQKKNLNV